MYDTPDGWDMDREEADSQQAELEAAGRSAYQRRRKSLALRLQGKEADAARMCPHSWTGNEGCFDCGSVLDHTRTKVLYPCAKPHRCLKCDAPLAILEGKAECKNGHVFTLKA